MWPLNPLAVRSDNIRYLLFTEEGRNEHSILAFNTYMALAYGKSTCLLTPPNLNAK